MGQNIRYSFLSIVSALTLSVATAVSAQTAARFSGGACASQGDWVQSALEQSTAVITALDTLRDDPNCTALVKTLDNSAELKTMSQSQGGDTAGMSGVFHELQAIREYIAPPQSQGMPPAEFREIVNYMVFRKSLETVNNIYITQQFDKLDQNQKQGINIASQRLKNFLDRASTVSNVAVTTAKSIAAALPNNELCFSKRPNEAALIFSSIVSSAAALATGGQISNVGEIVSTLTQFERQMHFAKILKGVELERFRASMSCLVESTQEAYCSLQDAQDTLNFNRGSKIDSSKFVESNPGSSAENSMQGLIVLLRDVPIITAWMQKILFGIDPKLQIEAKMKNTNWDSVINFIKTKNTLPAIYRDKRQIYYESTNGQDVQNKAAMIKDIISSLVAAMSPEADSSAGGTINFFANTMNSDRMPFFLLGIELPQDYNTRTNSFDNIYLNWTREQSHGLKNPDAVVDAIGDRLNQIIDQASTLSSSYFSSRMIVDSQNLIVEGMNGPSVSPYKALFHVKVYLNRLSSKLTEGLKNPAIADNSINQKAYKAMIPLLTDLMGRIDKITGAMTDLATGGEGGQNINNSERLARKKMDIIYEVANMLTARDSFIGNRVANAVRMDVTDTLWRNEFVDTRQSEVLNSMGKDIINRLSKYFTNDPILQRLDIAQAAPIHNQNMQAVEALFVNSYWEQLLEIDCKLFGGRMCTRNMYDPNTSFTEGILKHLADTFSFEPIRNFSRSFQKPTDDAAALYNLRAKLCAQTLGFTQYADRFIPFCQGANLISEFSDTADTKGLNFSYDKALKDVQNLKDSQVNGHISESRIQGACTLRSYIRRNLIYRMYSDIND